jgi:translocation and assembly module TamA
MATPTPVVAPASGEQSVIPYEIVCLVRNRRGKDFGEGPGGGKRPAAPAKPDDDDKAQADTDRIINAFKAVSLLHQLQGTPTHSLTGLEQRLNVSLGQGRDVLHSLGYYAGRVRGLVKRVDPKDGSDAQAKAIIVFIPGDVYRMGDTVVRANVPAVPPDGTKALPRSLSDVSLPQGAPAEAAAVLAAVDRVKEAFLDNGYPFATVTSTRYIVDHEKRTLDAEVDVKAGAFVRMGDIERHGANSVNPGVVENMRRWRVGRPWSKTRVESYQEALRQSGLFQSISIVPGDKQDAHGNRPVVTTLESAPERTVGGALKYHSDFGPGVQAFWENRNLSGAGDRLRVEMPLWLDMQEVTAHYRRPFFLRRDQDFVASGGFLNQDTDAYAITSAAAAGGIERRFNRHWSGSVKVSAEGGTIKEPDKERRDYTMYGLPLALHFDNTGSLLNAVKGRRVTLSVIPYTGRYEGQFSVLRTRADGQAFFPLAGEDAFVLATRASLGMVFGGSAQEIPPSARFYSGGGGSVRGYEYQSLGPRNSDNDPQGGNALMEVSAEGRWKFTPEWGLVAFLDGGTVFDNAVGQSVNFFDEDLRWGAGVGLRYYTAVGPVRFDVATPLNPRDDDDPVQFYISIGQSF